MTYRGIEGIYRGAPFNMVGDGFRVSNYFPYNQFGERISPFYFLDYHPPHEYPPTDNPRRGVGPHPHRGFETVTIAFEGSVAHHDSAGNAGVIHPGDVQWMTAGSGVLHREYHEEAFAKRGGVLHEAQLWVNLPKAHKMTAPKYQAITSSQMGVVELPDNGGRVNIIAGSYLGVKGPASTFSPINMFTIDLKKGGKADFTFPAAYNTAFLILKGTVRVNGGAEATEQDFVLFKNEDGEILLEGSSDDAKVLLLNGEPLNEPVVAYGPFVMNTREEILQAFDDFNSGKFGELEE